MAALQEDWRDATWLSPSCFSILGSDSGVVVRHPEIV